MSAVGFTPLSDVMVVGVATDVVGGVFACVLAVFSVILAVFSAFLLSSGCASRSIATSVGGAIEGARCAVGSSDKSIRIP